MLCKTFDLKSNVGKIDLTRTPSSDVIFVLASDDDLWCKKMFGHKDDVVFTSSVSNVQQPTFDLVVMSQCNHSISRYIFYFNMF